VVICLQQGADCLHIPKLPSSLASFKSRMVLPFFWYRLTQVVLETRLHGSALLQCCSLDRRTCACEKRWKLVELLNFSLVELILKKIVQIKV